MGVKSVWRGLFVCLIFFLPVRCEGSALAPTDNTQIIGSTGPAGPLLGNPTNWVDTDKSHSGSGGWGINYYNDLNSNGSHDPGEPFADTPGSGWKSAADNSCWLASACNMLEQIGAVPDAGILYNNYALNGVPDGAGGTLTWDDGGLQEYAIQHWMNQNPGSGLTMNVHWRSFSVAYTDAMYAWEDWNPRSGVDNYLNTGWEVAIGMWPLYTNGSNYWHDFGHALTIQDIAAAMTFDCTDSDRDGDFSAAGDLNTYNDATRGPTYYNGHNYYAWYNDFYDGNITVYPVGDVGYVCAVVPEPSTVILFSTAVLLVKKRKG